MATLSICVRFHEGRWHGEGPWPPAPARLFQALLAGAARGARVPEAAAGALRWLEGLGAPEIVAPPARRLREATLFVPNNDLDAVGGHPDRLAEVRVGKRVRPVVFEADAPLAYLWRGVEDCAEAAVLADLALDLHQLGRGVDPAWAEARLIDDAEAAALAGLRHRPGGGGVGGAAVPAPGSLDSLLARFAARGARLTRIQEGRRVVEAFAQPPKPRFAQVRYDAAPRRAVFALRGAEGAFAGWPLSEAGRLTALALESATARLSSTAPAMAALALRIIRGRGAGPDDLARRVRCWPVPSVGHPQADLGVRRLCVEVPALCPLAAEDVLWAFAGPLIDADGAVVGPDLAPEPQDMARRYLRRARVWKSVTPLALPAARRRIDPAVPAPKDGAERLAEERAAAGALLTALRRAELPAPVALRLMREPPLPLGAKAEDFSAGTRFDKHELWHACLTFAEPVAGPMILGDGRFAGLGLMKPAPSEGGIVRALAILGGLDAPDAATLARALRRALMARAEAEGGLTPFFSGHEPEGGPLRAGPSAHVAVVADLSRGRLLVIPPQAFDRRAARDRAALDETRRLDRLLAGLRSLRAGRAGLLRLGPAALDPGRDPLLAPARAWESATPYAPSRHPKGRDAEAALKDDLRAEARRRGLPDPAVELLAVEAGPRGALSVRARLRFATAQAGPVLLGRTRFAGGGLFAGAEG